jgi:hypothetical protein
LADVEQGDVGMGREVLMKSLLIVAALAGSAQADNEYDIKAVSYRGTYNQTCGAKNRMLRDKHVFEYKVSGAWINGMPWRLMNEPPGDVVMKFHDDKGQKVSLEMDVYINERGLFGTYTLLGVTPKGEFCSDIVEIRGSRR